MSEYKTLFVSNKEEAEKLALSLMSSLAWVTLRELISPTPNGFKYAVYYKEEYKV